MRTLARIVLALLIAAGPALAAAADAGGAPLPKIVVAFANEPLASPGPAGTTGSRYGGTGYSVGQSAQRQARSVAAAYALREVRSWPIQVLSMHCVVYEIANGRPVSEVVEALSKDSRVLLAQPLQEFHTLTGSAATEAGAAAQPAAAQPAAAHPAAATRTGADTSTNAAVQAAAAGAAGGMRASPYNDPLYDLQTNMSALGIARAHEHVQGAGVHIALIDTGVDLAHPDLKGGSLGSQSFLDRHAAAAALRHGTAMAGVMVAVANNRIGIVGIAPRAHIDVLEACWQLDAGSDAAACNTFTLARALAAALASGAQLVNLSIAGPADPLLTALVQAGMKHGVTFVGAAAGPDAPFPTGIPGVITAAGTEQPVTAGALAAPSQHVMTLRPLGEYDFESGSSIAAAEITAVLALLQSASPSRLSTSTLVSLLTGPTAVQAGTAAAVDVNAALARLDALRGGSTIAARLAAP
jgi:subtilisin family serine protease